MSKTLSFANTRNQAGTDAGTHINQSSKENEMNARQITIAVAGTGGKKEFQDVAILPGTKARDVLGKLGLDGFQLAKPEGGAFGHNDDLFGAVADGQKVYATEADVEAGVVDEWVVA